MSAAATARGGHPAGLWVLCSTQAWERFSFYGMRALLVLYLTEALLRPGRVEGVWGYAGLKAGLEAVFGPLSIQAMSSQIYGLYGGLVFFTPLVGGWLADRFLGQHRAVLAGGVLIALGHVLMAFDQTFLLALLSIILGSGLFTPAISAQVGMLYAPQDERRDRAYSLFYVFINIGGMLAPLVCGTVGERYGWHLGFSLAAVGMGLGLIAYTAAVKTLPADVRQTRDQAAATPLPPIEALLGLLVVCTLFWTTYSQLGNVLTLWLRNDSDLGLGGAALNVTWFQSLNPFFILLGTPLVIALWARQARGGREPSTLSKMALGCLFLAAGFLLLALPAGIGGKAHWAWTALAILAMTAGELHLAPTSWSLFSRLAPAGRETLMMGIWLLPLFVGGWLAGLMGGWWETMSHLTFWLLMAGCSALGAVAVLVVRQLSPVSPSAAA